MELVGKHDRVKTVSAKPAFEDEPEDGETQDEPTAEEAAEVGDEATEVADDQGSESEAAESKEA